MRSSITNGPAQRQTSHMCRLLPPCGPLTCSTAMPGSVHLMGSQKGSSLGWPLCWPCTPISWMKASSSSSMRGRTSLGSGFSLLSWMPKMSMVRPPGVVGPAAAQPCEVVKKQVVAPLLEYGVQDSFACCAYTGSQAETMLLPPFSPTPAGRAASGASSSRMSGSVCHSCWGTPLMKK